MTRWYLITAAVLGAGCEQLKSPQRIQELESRVNELATEVSALTGRPVGGKPKAEGDDHDDKSDDDEKSDHGKKPRKGEKGEKGEKPEKGAKRASAKVEAHDDKPDRGKGGHGKDDHGKDDHGKDDSKEEAKADEHGGDDSADGKDDAVARLRALVAKSTAARPGQKAHWGYDGKFGPAQWGELDPAWRTCQSGSEQSPIDIEPRSGSASPIKFRYNPTAATVVDNGHTLQVNMAEGSSIEIDGQPYALVQFHFHTPSEHTIAGEHYPLEVHLVHKDAEGKLAVVGVMYDAGAESRTLGAIWSKWPRKVGAEAKLGKPFDPSTLLPDTRSVYRYAGSLTTPPCTEGVVWNVMRRTLTDSKASLEAFARHYPRNARDLQALNERKVE